MYINLGQSVWISEKDIIGIFDLDNTTYSKITRAFLNQMEQRGNMVSVGEDLPNSFVLCQKENNCKIYLSHSSTATIKGRAEQAEKSKGDSSAWTKNLN